MSETHSTAEWKLWLLFDDVFVPNDRIFLNGEYEFAGVLVERFAGYHRQSYGGCKVGVGDVLIGALLLPLNTTVLRELLILKIN